MNKLYFLKKGNWEGLFVLCHDKECYGFLELGTDEFVLLQGTKQDLDYNFLIGAEEMVFHFLSKRGIRELYAREFSIQPEIVITPMSYYFKKEEEHNLSKKVLNKFFTSIASFMVDKDLTAPKTEISMVKKLQ